MKKFLYNIRLMLSYKDAVRTHVPFLFRKMICRTRRKQQSALRRLKGKNIIDVAFFLTIPGMWKADYLFGEMQKNPKYHPYVVIYPYSCNKGFSETEIRNTLDKTREFIELRGFEYIIPFDKETGKWLDIKKTLNPDIVFFTTPYRDIPSQYYLYNYSDRVTCYIPYAFGSMKLYKLNYDITSVNLYGFNFVETEMHRRFAQEYGRNHGVNSFVSGYPGTEVYLRSNYTTKDVWKPQEKQKKRVIWAPHHTIDNAERFAISTFLNYAEAILELAGKYHDTIQFAFKPHQLLKFKLQNIWGTEKTDEYYRRWAEGENTQLEEAGYVDLFLGSDAMIHDSGGFTTEYLFVQKPVMYLVKNDGQRLAFNDFGAMSFDCHYKGKSIPDIEHFLQSTVLNGDDPLKEQRALFFNEHLAPKDQLLPSQKIISILEEQIAKS